MTYVFYLNKYNSYIIEDLEHKPLLVTLGAGMAATHLTGPYFFYRPVNTTSYAEMLEVWLIM
jgi:hypothetical protein